MSFKNDIAKFNSKATKKATKVFRGTALSLFAKVIIATPVGNKNLWKAPQSAPPGYSGGRLRGNWQVGLNSKPDGVLDTTDAQGTATTGEAAKGVGRAKLGDKIYLINNLPYALPVENGSSTQAPSGMVKVTVAAFNAIVKGNIK